MGYAKRKWDEGADDATAISDFFRTPAGLVTAAVLVLIGIGAFVFAAVSGL